MRKAFKPIHQFVTENYFETVIILFSVLAMSAVIEQSGMPTFSRLIMPWVLLVLLFNKDRTIQSTCLALATLLLGLNLFGFYSIANHGFMIFYLGASVFIASIAISDRDDILRFNARFILAAMMALALLQKLLSPYYMSGNLIGNYTMGQHRMFENIFAIFIPELPNVHHLNALAETKLRDAMPSVGDEIGIKLPAIMLTIIMAKTYFSLAAQFFLELVLLFKKRLGIWVHYVLIAFVCMIYSTVNENDFLSMNCFLGYAMTDEKTKSVRVIYVFMIVFLIGSALTGIRFNLIS